MFPPLLTTLLNSQANYGITVLHSLPLRTPNAVPLAFYTFPYHNTRRADTPLDQGMDTSNPSAFVNAGLLDGYIGRKVRTIVQVINFDSGVVQGKSTDDGLLYIKGLPSSEIPPMNYVEVIGIADSNKSIKADMWTDFGKQFDTLSYNQLCQLANVDFRHLFL